MATELVTNSPVPGQVAAIATLGGTINSGVTTITSSGAAPVALQSAGQFRIVIDNEIMIVTAGAAGTSWTVTRGAEGSSAAGHTNGVSIYHFLTAGALQNLPISSGQLPTSVLYSTSPKFATTILTPSGSDDSAQINAAITALSGSGSVVLGPGTFLLNTATIAMPRAASGFTLRGAGRGVTVLKPAVGTIRAIAFPYVADYDSYTNITLEDFSIDASSLGLPASQNQSLIGNLSGSWNKRVNFDRIRLRRIRITGLPTNNTLTGTVYEAVSFGSSQAGTTIAAGSNGAVLPQATINVVSTNAFPTSGTLKIGSDTVTYTNVTGTTFTGCTGGTGTLSTSEAVMEGTQTSLTNLLFEDIDISGGNYGFAQIGQCLTSGNGTGAINVFYDQLVWNRLTWDSGVIPNSGVGTLGGGNQIGGGGFGGECSVSNCRFAGASDLSLEIDAPQIARVTDCTSTDAKNIHFLARNFNAPQYPNAQKIVFNRCHARVIGLTMQPTSAFSLGFMIQNNSGPLPSFGHAEITECSYTNQQTAFPVTGMAITVQDVPVQKLTVRDFDVVVDKLVDTGSAVNVGLIQVRPSSNHVLDMKNVRFVLAGSTSNASLAPSYIRVGSTSAIDIQLSIDGVEITNQLTGVTATLTSGIQLGSGNTSGTYHGTIRRLKILPGWSGDSNPRGILVNTSAANNAISGELLVTDCDFQQWSGIGSGVEIKAALAADQSKIRSSGNKWRVFPKLSTGTLSGLFTTTTFVTNTGNQYIGMDPATVHFASGTGAGITAIAISKDNSVFENVYSQASGAMAQDVLQPVDNADLVRITFSGSQPTIRVRFGRS